MHTYIYKKELPLPHEYNLLRENVGWAVMDAEAVSRGLSGTVFGVSVYDGDRIIGSGRIVGDGILCFYLQDVMVHRDFQKQGIGSAIVAMLMEYIDAHAVYNSYVGLMAAKGMEFFYEKFGFMQRPNEHFGCGMTFFWGRKGEMTES